MQNSGAVLNQRIVSLGTIVMRRADGGGVCKGHGRGGRANRHGADQLPL
jgi:hypothetical protein